MLYKAQGAQLQPMVEVTRQLSQAGFDAFTAFDELGNSIGTTLSTSFEAAMISGEDFFKVFIQGLFKNMLAQLLAAVAAALVLAALLVVITWRRYWCLINAVYWYGIQTSSLAQ